MILTTHTPGPWRWCINRKSRILELEAYRLGGGTTVIQPTRWGMDSATIMAGDHEHVLHKLQDRPDWIAHFQGRGHHAKWAAGVCHPDLRLIEAAPVLLDCLQRIADDLVAMKEHKLPDGDLCNEPTTAWAEQTLSRVVNALATAMVTPHPEGTYSDTAIEARQGEGEG
jgi:hypothetical protein